MPDFIATALENFWNGQGKALVMSYVVAALGYLVLHLHLNGFISAATLTSWSAVIVGALGVLVLNLTHHSTANANVAPADTSSPKASAPESGQVSPPPPGTL